MEDFIKYPSTRNTYDHLHIRKWINRYPEIENCRYIITEKIHGSNFQILINSDGMKYFSRNEEIKSGDKFFNYEKMLENYENVWDVFKRYVKSTGQSIRLYGEYFGDGIIKGVSYGKEQRYRIFSIYINDIRLSPEQIICLLEMLRIPEIYVPILGFADNIVDAMVFDIKRNTTLFEKEDNEMEGVVITPFSLIFETEQGSFFSLKSKGERFKEIMYEKKREKVFIVDDTPEELKELRNIFQTYINKNRANGIMSKFGMIDDMNNLGKYIKYLIEDARIDFLDDNDITGLTKDEMKYIFNAGKQSAKIIMSIIKGE